MSTFLVAIMVIENQKELNEGGCCFTNLDAVKDYRDCSVGELPIVNNKD